MLRTSLDDEMFLVFSGVLWKPSPPSRSLFHEFSVYTFLGVSSPRGQRVGNCQVFEQSAKDLKTLIHNCDVHKWVTTSSVSTNEVSHDGHKDEQ